MAKSPVARDWAVCSGTIIAKLPDEKNACLIEVETTVVVCVELSLCRNRRDRQAVPSIDFSVRDLSPITIRWTFTPDLGSSEYLDRTGSRVHLTISENYLPA